MVKLYLLIIVIIWGCINPSLYGEDVYVCQESLNGKSWVYFIRDTRLSNLPKWEGDSKIPLSVDKALSEALRSSQINKEGFSRRDLYIIKLTSFVSINKKPIWMYEVIFFKDRDLDTSTASVFILMDGGALNRVPSKKWYDDKCKHKTR